VGVFKAMDQMTEVGLASCNLGPDGAKVVADYILVSASLTKVSLRDNKLEDAGAVAIGTALRDSKVSELQEMDLAGNRIAAEGAKAIAAYIFVSASLTNLS
jgi:Ran GTPase-activating protein (RanGAP) involved in mRNA processing and transport